MTMTLDEVLAQLPSGLGEYQWCVGFEGRSKLTVFTKSRFVEVRVPRGECLKLTAELNAYLKACNNLIGL